MLKSLRILLIPLFILITWSLPTNTIEKKEVVNKSILTIDQYCEDPKTHKDRRTLYPTEFTIENERNATELLAKVNALLQEIKWVYPVISSGWRPKEVNIRIKTAAINSDHIIGKAIDIKDPKGYLKKRVTYKLLVKYDLYCEDFKSTPGWVHFQLTRPYSWHRFFKP